MVLERVTRKSVIELCAELDIRCSVRPVLVQELLQADEIFVTTTAGGPMPVSRINGRMMGKPTCRTAIVAIEGHVLEEA